MQKKYFIALVMLLLGVAMGCKPKPDNLDWQTNLEDALAQAQKENKAVLVNFTGSDWCPWCIRLSDEVFSQKEFKDYAAQKLILVKIDFPRNTQLPDAQKQYNQALAGKFRIEGFPTVVLLRKDGSVIAYTGYREGGAAGYVEHLSTML